MARLFFTIICISITIFNAAEIFCQQVPVEPASFDEKTLELQVKLDRLGIRPGVIDGKPGRKTEQAYNTWRRISGAAELISTAPAVTTYTLTAGDFEGLAPAPKEWRAKSQVKSLGYENVLERLTERFHASEELLQKLNPEIDWTRLKPGTIVKVPDVGEGLKGRAERLEILLDEKLIRAIDAGNRIIAQFPCSIAQKVAKQPVGTLRITTIIKDPAFTFDPEVFTEVHNIKEKLLIPPGPNNPVGVRWIALSRAGYGIHGTPEPLSIGKTGSHGCFRLSNWDAESLADLVEVGTPVIIKR